MVFDSRARILAALAALAIAPVLAHCSAASGPTIPESSGSSSGSSNSGSDDSDSGSSGESSGDLGSGSSSGNVGDDSSTGDDGGTSVLGVDGGACAANTMYPQPGNTFVPLAIAPGTKVVQGQSDTIPDAGVAPPTGWDFHQGGLCRDGSPAGFYVHFSASASTKLYIYLEGGGACDSATFCTHNPANLNSVFSGGAASQGQTIGGSLTFTTAPQEPYVASNGYSPGIFDFTNTANPFKDWNAVYVPYCTGDVHFGTKDNVDIPDQGITAGVKAQHFVGRKNLEGYISRIVPTFPGLTQVMLTGASAGGFGAGLNYGMVQDSFGKVPVIVLDDSGPPFSSTYLPACLQKQWRDLWGFDAALPSDCTECNMPDGSGLTNVVYYWLHKYPHARVGVVSTMQDEVIRLFFAQGNMMCASDDATLLAVGQVGGYTGMQYTMGLDELLSTFQCTGRLATYLIGGMNPMYMNPTYHQHIFRNEFYQAIDNAGTMTMAAWAQDFIDGKLEQVGP
ncbi:MAG TPA: pectin acetylesterase-family hydrolase [Polyangiaceae bacterium]|jgi:hypothetical protein|nr:pectin acetylesterase-family hydrolase [Polyangiaceae bacterium]